MTPSIQGMQELIDHMPKSHGLHGGPQDQEIFGFDDITQDDIERLAEERKEDKDRRDMISDMRGE